VCSGLVTGQYPVKMSYQMYSTKILKPEKRRELALLSHIPEKKRYKKSPQRERQINNKRGLWFE